MQFSRGSFGVVGFLSNDYAHSCRNENEQSRKHSQKSNLSFRFRLLLVLSQSPSNSLCINNEVINRSESTMRFTILRMKGVWGGNINKYRATAILTAPHPTILPHYVEVEWVIEVNKCTQPTVTAWRSFAAFRSPGTIYLWHIFHAISFFGFVRVL